MKKKYYLISAVLLVCLFIYLFYRTEKTVINRLFIDIVSIENYSDLRHSITTEFPLHNLIVYSLPEGLWVFSATLISKDLFVLISKFKLDLFLLPLVFSIGLELLQFFNFTNGRFDIWDVLVSVLFWFVGSNVLSQKSKRQNIFNPVTTHSIICLTSYFIVYLSYVSK